MCRGEPSAPIGEVRKGPLPPGLPPPRPRSRLQGRRCGAAGARPRLLARPPLPPRRARSRPGLAPVPSPRSAAPRTAPGAEPTVTTDSGGASSRASPAGPGNCRKPQKLTVFLPRARHGEVTSRDPAPGQVRPRVAAARPPTAPPAARRRETRPSSAAPPPPRSPGRGRRRRRPTWLQRAWEHSKRAVARGLEQDARVVR